jgi:hypothetical protein
MLWLLGTREMGPSGVAVSFAVLTGPCQHIVRLDVSRLFLYINLPNAQAKAKSWLTIRKPIRCSAP